MSGLTAASSPPRRVLEAVQAGRLVPVASWELAEEIVAVFRRPRLARYGISEDDVADVLFLLAPLLPAVHVDVELRDPDDVPVVASALAGRAEAIVTGDRGLLDDEDLRAWLADRGVRLLTPPRFDTSSER